MAELKLDNVVKIYGKTEVIHGLNLDIRNREFLVLVGPSGCGKSTLLRMVAGLEEISGGTIAIDGKVVNDIAPKDRGLSMVFQNYALYPHMNVFDNMSFGLKLKKTPTAEIHERVREVATILGLEELLSESPTSCPAASASVWPWDGPWSESLPSSSLTNPYPIWMPNSGFRCGPRSSCSTSGWIQR